MPAESPHDYPTLRRTRTVLRVLGPLIGVGMSLAGLWLFGKTAYPKLTGMGYGTYERLIWGVIGLGYMLGLPLAGYVIQYLLRAGADLIELLIDSELAAEKTADLVERQLVPGINRIGQLLEKTNETLARAGAVRPVAGPSLVEARQQAIDGVREAMRREWWDQAKRLATSFAEKFSDAPEAKELPAQVEAAYRRKVESLRSQLDESLQANDPDATLNARDRLAPHLEGAELATLDRRVARRVIAYVRESLAEGRARDAVPIAERLVNSMGDTTSEGAQLRAALPTLRRSIGLCPDCGQPYDVSLARCPACEAKRTAGRAAATPSKKT